MYTSFMTTQLMRDLRSTRSFLTRAYPTMKHHNPHTPIMVREALNTQPRVFARYEFGREKVEELGGEFVIFFCRRIVSRALEGHGGIHMRVRVENFW